MSVVSEAVPKATEPPVAHEPIRLLVVDDHAAVRMGLRELLDNEPDFEVAAAVATADAALSLAEDQPLDVAVVDYQLSDRNGLWVSRKLKRLSHPPAVVIYSAYADGVLPAAAVVSQADAVISKGGPAGELYASIRAVARGRRVLPPLPQWLGEVLRDRFDHLEQTIFGMLLSGIDPGDVAKTLDLSTAGLESQLGDMLRRLEAPTTEERRQAVRMPHAA